MKRLSYLATRYMGKNMHRTLTTLVGVILSTILIYSIFACGYSVYDNIMYNRYLSSMGWDAMFVCDMDTAKEMLSLDSYYHQESAKKEQNPSVDHAWIMTYDRFYMVHINDFNAMPVPYHVRAGSLPNGKNGVAVSLEYMQSFDGSIGSHFYEYMPEFYIKSVYIYSIRFYAMFLVSI